MAKPNVLILRAPGTNCDLETAFAFEQAGATTEAIHINRLIEEPHLAADFQIFCIPGGFSYGDDIAAGRILSSQIHSRLADCFRQFAEKDKLILGICNGFQVLISTGLLLRSDEQGPLATLTENDSAKFEDRWVNLRVAGNRCVMLSGVESMYLPIAHAEGKFVTRDPHALQQLEEAGQLVLRYVSRGEADAAVHYPENPNGSLANVAGVCDTTGRILGLMPHPERHIDPTHHPRWTREAKRAEGDGMAIFRNATEYFL